MHHAISFQIRIDMNTSNPHTEYLKFITRRQFFKDCGTGLGTLALASLLNRELFAATPMPEDPAAPKAPHFAPRAKRIIYLHMAGAPSQLDMFDYKPTLQKLNGQKIPEEIIKGERFAFIRGVPKLLNSPYTITRHGQSGAAVSNLLPNLTHIVDDLAFVKSMHTNHFNHAPAQVFMHAGHTAVGRPSMGSWLTYGLGSETSDLPSFVVLVSGRLDPGAGSSCW